MNKFRMVADGGQVTNDLIHAIREGSVSANVNLMVETPDKTFFISFAPRQLSVEGQDLRFAGDWQVDAIEEETAVTDMPAHPCLETSPAYA